MRSTSIVAVVVAAILILLPVFIVLAMRQPANTPGVTAACGPQSNPLIHCRYYNEILWRCDDSIGDKYCQYLVWPIRMAMYEISDNLNEVLYKMRRSSIPKSELPVLRIYMTDGAIGKLRKKRDEALSQPFPILITRDDDWVSATIISDDGKNQKNYNVNLVDFQRVYYN